MINSQEVENGRMKIMDVNFIFDGGPAKFLPDPMRQQDKQHSERAKHPVGKTNSSAMI